MPAIAQTGIHFSTPWLFEAHTIPAANLLIYTAAAAALGGDATNFFTEMATRGLQDTTNWVAGTYKTILSVSSGKGLVAGYIGCTAGGAETHTVEFTVDGVLTTVAIVNANTERAVLWPGMLPDTTAFTTAAKYLTNIGSLDAGKTTFQTFNPGSMAPWGALGFFGVPLLQFNQSLLVRAKHSATITNSTATAYSALMYRLGL